MPSFGASGARKPPSSPKRRRRDANNPTSPPSLAVAGTAGSPILATAKDPKPSLISIGDPLSAERIPRSTVFDLQTDVIDSNTNRNTRNGYNDKDDAADDHSAVDSSEDSLLPSLSDDEGCTCSDEESSVGSQYEGLARLERKLDLRMARLRRICAGRRPSYVRLLEFHEATVREISVAEYKQTHREGTRKHRPVPSERIDGLPAPPARTTKASDATGAESSADGGPQGLCRTPPLYLRLWWWLLFEGHHTIPGSVKLLVVCMAHLTFYNLLDYTLWTIYESFFVGLMQFSTFVVVYIVAGLALMRGNGSLFTVLGGSSYNMVKFEMHNRLRLGHADARLMEYFKNSIWGSAANMFAFYLIYSGLVHFYNDRTHQKFNVLMVESYTMIRDQAAQQVPEPVDLKFYDKSNYTGQFESPKLSGVEQQTCAILEEYVAPPFQWWFRYCCADPFQEFRLHDLTFHGFWFFLTAGVAAWMGINVLTLCDEGA